MVCELCGKHRDKTKRNVVYTARNLGENSQKLRGGSQITTSYGEFEEHVFNVCQSCSIKHTFIFPLVTYLVAVPLIMLLLDMKIGGALFFALFPAGFAFWKLNVTSTLMRVAISERRRTSPHGEGKNQLYHSDFKGYTSYEYNMLPKSLETLLHEAEKDWDWSKPDQNTCHFCHKVVTDRNGGISTAVVSGSDMFDLLNQMAARKFVCPSCSAVFCLECGNKKGESLGTGSTHCPNCGVRVL